MVLPYPGASCAGIGSTPEERESNTDGMEASSPTLSPSNIERLGLDAGLPDTLEGEELRGRAPVESYNEGLCGRVEEVNLGEERVEEVNLGEERGFEE